jgi:molybdate transport system substrate-binding protein
MKALVDEGMIRGDSVRDLWGNRLVLVGRAGSDAEKGWEILRDPGVRRIALGETRSVPAGRYGREVLEHLGLWEKLQGRIVLTKDVRQALVYVANEAADAAIVYQTDLETIKGLTVLAEAPPDSHTPIRYPAGITTRSKNAEEAESFILFLASGVGGAHFVRHGFVPLAEEP